MYHDELDGTGEFSHSQIDELFRSGAAAPTTGTWQRGDRVWNSEPSPTEYIGWVCTTAGTPGVWKGFGEIEA